MFFEVVGLEKSDVMKDLVGLKNCSDSLKQEVLEYETKVVKQPAATVLYDLDQVLSLRQSLFLARE